MPDTLFDPTGYARLPPITLSAAGVLARALVTAAPWNPGSSAESVRAALRPLDTLRQQQPR